MIWVRQRRGYELGNFIMATPAIRLIKKITGQPVPVFFDNPIIYDLFIDCKFITRISKLPDIKAVVSSYCSRPNKWAHLSDYDLQCRKVCKAFRLSNVVSPKPYVDRPTQTVFVREPGKRYIAFMHGCLGKTGQKIDAKRIPWSVRRFAIHSAINSGFIPVIIGHKRDRKLFWKNLSDFGDAVIDFCGAGLSLRQAVGVLADCDYFISNDTGLYHVAGALKMQGVVMWYRTSHQKNLSPCPKITHSVSLNRDVEIYKESVGRFIRSVR